MGNLWWVGPLHVMTQVDVYGIYNPLEVHVERFEFNFYIKSNLKTSISYLLGVCGPVKSKQFCTVFNLLLNCFLLGLHVTVEEDQIANASLLPLWSAAGITAPAQLKSMEMELVQKKPPIMPS